MNSDFFADLLRCPAKLKNLHLQDYQRFKLLGTWSSNLTCLALATLLLSLVPFWKALDVTIAGWGTADLTGPCFEESAFTPTIGIPSLDCCWSWSIMIAGMLFWPETKRIINWSSQYYLLLENSQILVQGVPKTICPICSGTIRFCSGTIRSIALFLIQ